jgi:hypothetical protein
LFISITADYAQNRFQGYVYTFQNGREDNFQYTVRTREDDGDYKTIYKLYSPITGKHRFTVIASHLKSEKKVIVEVHDEQYLLGVMNNKEEITYGEPSLNIFGTRGDVAFFDKSAPNQLAVQFVSNRFEFLRVSSFLGSTEDGIFQYIIFNKNDKIQEPKLMTSNYQALNKKEYVSKPFNLDSSKNNGLLKIHFVKDLSKVYGVDNLLTKNVYDEENKLMGKNYILIPNSKNEVIIYAKQGKIISFDFKKESGSWKLPFGLKVGMSIQEVVKLNGNDFTVNNPETDGGGYVLDWRNGKFTNRDFSIVFSEVEENDPKAYSELIGKESFVTSDKILSKLKMVVTEIIINSPEK